MTTAWMLRNDGKAIPVSHHIYADPEDGDDILCAAEWLYINTGCTQIKTIIERTFALWAWDYNDLILPYETLIDYAAENERFFPDSGFIKEHLKTALEKLEKDKALIISNNDIKDYYDMVLLWLNQEFLRVRYGGMYETEKGCKDIIFRISSVGFDWYPLIQDFLASSELDIRTVTIVRDAESTGAGNASYHALDGHGIYDHMPIKDFQNEYLSVAPKNHLYCLEGSSDISTRQLRASLFVGFFPHYYNISETIGEVFKEIKGANIYENGLVK